MSYQWYVGSTAISGATSATLTLDPVLTKQAGNYTVVELPTAGWVSTSPSSVPITVTSGNNQTVNFGNFQLISVSGQVFADNNADGIKNGADAGLANRTLTLFDASNAVVGTATGNVAAFDCTICARTPALLAQANAALRQLRPAR